MSALRSPTWAPRTARVPRRPEPFPDPPPEDVRAEDVRADDLRADELRADDDVRAPALVLDFVFDFLDRDVRVDEPDAFEDFDDRGLVVVATRILRMFARGHFAGGTGPPVWADAPAHYRNNTGNTRIFDMRSMLFHPQNQQPQLQVKGFRPPA